MSPKHRKENRYQDAAKESPFEPDLKSPYSSTLIASSIGNLQQVKVLQKSQFAYNGASVQHIRHKKLSGMNVSEQNQDDMVKRDDSLASHDLIAQTPGPESNHRPGIFQISVIKAQMNG